MALDAYKPALIQEFLPKDMSERHARHIMSWLKDHPKRTLEPIAKVSLPFVCFCDCVASHSLQTRVLQSSAPLFQFLYD